VRLAPLLQKYHTRNAEALAGTSPCAWRLPSRARHGLQRLGRTGGRRPADFSLFDLDQPHLYRATTWSPTWSIQQRSSDVTHVVVDGRLIYRDRELLTLMKERIMAEANGRARRMWGRR